MRARDLLALSMDALLSAGEDEVEVFARAHERGFARFHRRG